MTLCDANPQRSRFVCSYTNQHSFLPKCFPNADAIITFDGGREERWKKMHFGAKDGPSEAQLYVYYPISMDTLSSLFQYPTKWARKTEIHLIETLSSIEVGENGALVERKLKAKPADLLLRNWSDACRIDIRQCNRIDTIEETIQQLLRFGPKLLSTAENTEDVIPPCFTFFVKSGPSLDAYLRMVRHFFLALDQEKR